MVARYSIDPACVSTYIKLGRGHVNGFGMEDPICVLVLDSFPFHSFPFRGTSGHAMRVAKLIKEESFTVRISYALLCVP